MQSCRIINTLKSSTLDLNRQSFAEWLVVLQQIYSYKCFYITWTSFVRIIVWHGNAVYSRMIWLAVWYGQRVLLSAETSYFFRIPVSWELVIFCWWIQTPDHFWFHSFHLHSVPVSAKTVSTTHTFSVLFSYAFWFVFPKAKFLFSQLCFYFRFFFILFLSVLVTDMSEAVSKWFNFAGIMLSEALLTTDFPFSKSSVYRFVWFLACSLLKLLWNSLNEYSISLRKILYCFIFLSHFCTRIMHFSTSSTFQI